MTEVRCPAFVPARSHIAIPHQSDVWSSKHWPNLQSAKLSLYAGPVEEHSQTLPTARESCQRQSSIVTSASSLLVSTSVNARWRVCRSSSLPIASELDQTHVP